MHASSDKTVFETGIRRLIAVAPELVLAWSCYQGAVDTLAGAEPGFYLIGLIMIELLSLAWLRLVLAPSAISGERSLVRRVLGIGGTGIAALVFFWNLVFAGIALLFVMFADPRTFVLLLLALSRRSIWRWSWALDSVNDLEEIAAHAKRAFRAHYLALALALFVSLVIGLASGMDTTGEVSDALWLAGMAGYFVATAIYMLFGKVPVATADSPDHESNTGTVTRPGIPVPDFPALAIVFLKNYYYFVPGVLFLWFVVGVIGGALEPDLRVPAFPVVVSLGAWMLFAGAARAFDITSESLWGFGLSRSTSFIKRLIALSMIALFMLLLSVPITYGILGREIVTGEYTADTMVGFAVAMLVIAYVLIRLWPTMVLPFIFEPEDNPPFLPYACRMSWKMTAGGDGFLRGAVVPILLFAPVVALMQLPESIFWIGKLLNYGLFAPLIAFLMLERTVTMAHERVNDAGLSGDQAPITAGAMDEGSDIPIPIPVPLPSHSSEQKPDIPPPVFPPPSSSSVNRSNYPANWTDRDIFFGALEQQDIPMMRKMLAAGINVNIKIERTPALLWSAQIDRPGSFRFLLQSGADITRRGPIGAGVLHYVAGADSMVSFIPELVDKLGEVDMRDDNGQTPLMSALLRGCIAGAQALLDRGADPLATDLHGQTVLHHFVSGIYGFRKGTAQPEKIRFLRQLLAYGIDPLVPGRYGDNAVIAAARKGMVDVIEVFRDVGVDLGQADGKGVTPMAIAAVNREFDVVLALQGTGQPVDLVSAVCLGQLEVVKTLIEQDKESIRKKHPPYNTALLAYAIHHGHRDVADYLLEQGAEVTGDDRFGGSCLHNAIRSLPEVDFIKKLIDLGADLEAVDGDLNTPLNFAARDDRIEIARLMLKAGANANAQTERGYPPSYFASSDEMVELLNRYTVGKR